MPNNGYEIWGLMSHFNHFLTFLIIALFLLSWKKRDDTQNI